MLKYQSIRELTEAAEAEHLKISELVLKEQAEAMEQVLAVVCAAKVVQLLLTVA